MSDTAASTGTGTGTGTDEGGYRSPLLDLPGAVPADPPDAGVAAHYGDPLREQRGANGQAAGGAVLVDRSHRGVLTITGPDRLTWLHNLTTQHLSDLPAGSGAEALVLSPHGHVEHHLLIADDGATSWLDVEPGTVPALLAFLSSMRFMLRVDPVDATGSYAVLSLVGPSAEGVVSDWAGGGLELPAAPRGVVPLPGGGGGEGGGEAGGEGGGFARRRPDGLDLLVPRARLTAVWDGLREAGATPGGIAAHEALRTARREPRLGVDTDHRTIPNEVGWLDGAVHLDKGCYRGQETVARVHNLGRPPRRLVLLHLDGALVPIGTPLTWAGRNVGAVGTAAVHHELGPIALGLVKRSVPDDAPLVADGVAAAIDPGHDAVRPEPGGTAQRPKLARLR